MNAHVEAPGDPSMRSPRRFLRAALLVTACLISACDLPRDPEKSFEQLAARPLRVGLAEHPPFVMLRGGDPAGVEVALIEEFAAAAGTTVEWTTGTVEQLLPALEHFQLDLVAAGLTDATPWKKKIGMTRPWLETQWRVGFPAGFAAPDSLEGVEVAIDRRSEIAALLRKEKARVRLLPDPFAAATTATPPVAAEDWRLALHGYRLHEKQLKKERHIIAAAPGENRLLHRLDKFLHACRNEIPLLLQKAVTAQEQLSR